MKAKDIMAKNEALSGKRGREQSNFNSMIAQDMEMIKTFLIGHWEKSKDRRKHIKSLCPFHEEGDPSFAVYPDSLTYQWFACGAYRTVKDLLKHLGWNANIKVGAKIKPQRKSIRLFNLCYEKRWGK
jgi:hypothetical protein